MKKICSLAGIAVLLALPALAQKDDSPRPPLPDRGTCLDIPDDLYDGTLASMACMMIPGTAGTVTDVEVSMGVDHTWVGDLTVKLVSPSGTVSTLQSRAGADEMVDDGSGPVGTNADLVATAPVNYLNGAATSAEDMGAAGSVICQDDGICDYFPFPDAGPGTDLDDFDGEEGGGDWMLCVGDGAGADVGQICSAALTIQTAPAVPVTEVPTANTWGLLALLVMLGGLGVFFVRRMA